MMNDADLDKLLKGKEDTQPHIATSKEMDKALDEYYDDKKECKCGQDPCVCENITADAGEGNEINDDTSLSGEQSNDTASAGGNDKRFSQADVDRIVKQRLAREAKKGTASREMEFLTKKAAAHGMSVPDFIAALEAHESSQESAKRDAELRKTAGARGLDVETLKQLEELAAHKERQAAIDKFRNQITMVQKLYPEFTENDLSDELLSAYADDSDTPLVVHYIAIEKAKATPPKEIGGASVASSGGVGRSKLSINDIKNLPKNTILSDDDLKDILKQ
jgi:hypothetical protein